MRTNSDGAESIDSTVQNIPQKDTIPRKSEYRLIIHTEGQATNKFSLTPPPETDEFSIPENTFKSTWNEVYKDYR